MAVTSGARPKKAVRMRIWAMFVPPLWIVGGKGNKWIAVAWKPSQRWAGTKQEIVSWWTRHLGAAAALVCNWDGGLLVRLLSRLGCRVSECLGIRVEDVNFAKGTVTSQGNLHQQPRKRYRIRLR